MNSGDNSEEVELREKEAEKEIKQLILEDASLTDIRVDKWLTFITRSRNCRPPATMRMLKAMMEYRRNTYPEILKDIHGNSVQAVLESRVIRVLNRTEDVGPALLVFRTSHWTTSFAGGPGDFSMDSLIVATLLYGFEIAMRSVEVQRQGVYLIMDVGDFGFRHARQCTYGNITKLANCIIFGAPFRVLGASVINCPYAFEKVYQVVKFAIPERFRSYVNVTKNDFSHIHSIVGPQQLPLSLGGTIPEQEAWEMNVEESIMQNDYVSEFLNDVCPILKDT